MPALQETSILRVVQAYNRSPIKEIATDAETHSRPSLLVEPFPPLAIAIAGIGVLTFSI